MQNEPNLTGAKSAPNAADAKNALLTDAPNSADAQAARQDAMRQIANHGLDSALYFAAAVVLFVVVCASVYIADRREYGGVNAFPAFIILYFIAATLGVKWLEQLTVAFCGIGKQCQTRAYRYFLAAIIALVATYASQILGYLLFYDMGFERVAGRAIFAGNCITTALWCVAFYSLGLYAQNAYFRLFAIISALVAALVYLNFWQRDLAKLFGGDGLAREGIVAICAAAVLYALAWWRFRKDAAKFCEICD